MPAYDRQYNAPAPVADVVVAHPVTGQSSQLLRGKLDTGAGLSIIPQRLVNELALSPHGQISACSYDGAYSRRHVYYARFTVEGHPLEVYNAWPSSAKLCSLGAMFSIISLSLLMVQSSGSS